MAPSHPTALRCQATTLARLGHQPRAISQADQAVTAAEESLRAAEDKSALSRPASIANGHSTMVASSPWPDRCAASISALDAAAGGTTEHAIAATASSRVDCNRTQASAPPSSIGFTPRFPSRVLGDRTRAPCSASSTSFMLKSASMVDWDRTRTRAPPRSIGFMPGSKVTVVVGGLLQTGGGGADALYLAKSLTLRGCLRQKAGRVKTAEEDYRRALVICRKQVGHLDRCSIRHGDDEPVDGRKHDDDEHVNGTAGAGKEAWRGERFVEGEKPNSHQSGGQGGLDSPHFFEGEIPSKNINGCKGSLENSTGSLDERSSSLREAVSANDTIESGASNMESFNNLPARFGNQRAHEAGDTRGSRNAQSCPQEPRTSYERAVLRLESLIHHNLSTLHMAAVFCEETQASFQKVCGGHHLYDGTSFPSGMLWLA